MVVVLPEPLTPTTRITNGRCGAVDHQRLRAGRENLDDAAAQRRDQRLDVGELLARHALAQLVQNVLLASHADVGGDQARLELLEDRRIDLPTAQQVRQIVAEPGIAAVEPLAQPAQKPRTIFGRSRCCGRAAEHARHCSGPRDASGRADARALCATTAAR